MLDCGGRRGGPGRGVGRRGVCWAEREREMGCRLGCGFGEGFGLGSLLFLSLFFYSIAISNQTQTI